MQTEASLGLFLPALNVADLDGDGENFFGLTGLAGTTTNVLINSAVGGKREKATERERERESFEIHKQRRYIKLNYTL